MIVMESVSTSTNLRDVCCVLLGAAMLVLKSHYSGPGEILVHSYAGNIGISFAVYYIALHLPMTVRRRRLAAAVMALAAVELFELFDGFGVMSNVFDPWDLPANLLGVAGGFALDTVLARQR